MFFSNEAFADLILFIHFLYVLTVVVPVPLILLGAIRKWKWIRNRLFRRIHVAMIFVVAVEALLGVACPLTLWEAALRPDPPQEESSFMSYWVSEILFWEFEPWIFTLTYVLFGGLVGLLYWLIPPVSPRRKTLSS